MLFRHVSQLLIYILGYIDFAEFILCFCIHYVQVVTLPDLAFMGTVSVCFCPSTRLV